MKLGTFKLKMQIESARQLLQALLIDSDGGRPTSISVFIGHYLNNDKDSLSKTAEYHAKN